MSLIAFHRVLITAGILFSGGFAAWEIDRFVRGGGAVELLLGAAFGAAAIALFWYLLNLDRFLGQASGG